MRITPVRLVLVYLVASAAWILLSDAIVASAGLPDSASQLASTMKGWLFVAVTATGLLVFARALVRTAEDERARATRAGEEAARSAQTLHLALEAEQVVLRAASEQELLDGVCAAIVADARFALCSIAWVEPSPDGAIIVAAVAASSPDAVDRIGPVSDAIADGDGPTASAARHGQTVVIDDSRRDPRLATWRDRLAAIGVPASAALPIRSDGVIVAVMSVYTRASGELDAAVVKQLERVADELGFGIGALRAREGRKAARARLVEREARLFAILEGSPNAILILGEGARVEFANAAADGAFGAAEGQLVGMAIATLVPDIEPVLAHAAVVSDAVGRAEAMTNPIDVEARRLEGATFPVQVLIAPVDVLAGSVTVVTLVDQSERIALEARVSQRERLELLGQFAGIVAHDVRNYLTAVSWSADFVHEAIGPDHPAVRDVELIQRSTAEGIAMTRTILEFARPAASVRGRTELAPYLEGIRDLVARVVGDGVQFELDVAPDLPPAGLASEALTQVIVNLAANSRDAMPDGGTFTIRATALRPAPRRRRDDASAAADRQARLEVVDTGAGMDDETRRRAFDPFFSTKGSGFTASGTGLGLSGVYLAVTRAGGTIALDSTPGVGTTVIIDLPAAAPE